MSRATSIFTVKRRKEEDGTINWFFTLTLASLPFLEFSIFSGATRQGWDVIVWGCNPRSIFWSFHKSCWMSKENCTWLFFGANQIVLASALFLLLNNCFLFDLIMWDFIGWSRRIILAAMAWGVWSKIYSLPLLKKIFWYLLCFLIASLIFWVAVPYQ